MSKERTGARRMLGFEAAPIVTRKAKRSEDRMRKKTWRRASSPAAWALALVLGAPALVEAQTQLFPLAPIRRERPPCPVEDPVYGMYRHQYFGYFPTCWRTFPPGWGCPSPEAPNAAAAFEKQPRDKPREISPDMEEEPGLGPMPGEGPAAPRRTPLPPLPGGERSPFDIEPAPGANPNAPLQPGERMMPAPENPGGRTPRQGRVNPPSTTTMARRGGPTPATTPTPTATPTPGAPAESTGDSEKNAAQADEGTGPLFALPDPAEAAPNATPPGIDNGNGNGAVPGPGPATGVEPPEHTGALPGPLGPPTASTSSPPPSAVNPNVVQLQPMTAPSPNPGGMLPAGNVLAPAASAPVQNPTPVQAPQRRGPIGTLFNGMTSWLRR